MIDKNKLLELLQQYEATKKEIKKLGKRLKAKKKLSTMVSDVVQNGYKRHKVIYGVDYKRLDTISYIKSLLQKRYDRLLECEASVTETLNELPSDIRQILEHRYIDGMNWIQIQFAMGYDHEDKARKKHDRFFEKK